MAYEDSESEESEEDDTAEVADDPMWVLYNKVRQYETPAGIRLAEPFMTLPSKREFPDYYEIVKDPISLNQVRKKLKLGEYSDVQDLAGDLELIFENCKLYNRAESRLYKDGVRLQKIYQAKLEELKMESDEDDNKDTDEEKKSPQRDAAKKRMRVMYNAVLHHRNRDGLEPVGMFMEKPSRKDYPDYYEVIAHPIDMNTINERIRSGYYKTSEIDFIDDMKLMFSNCRLYNEEGSQIYEDANVLERVLMNKAKDLGVIQHGKRGRKKSMKTTEKMRTLFETVRDHRDSKGRQLCLIFLRLPNPKEMPEYFEVIKNPIDFEVISSKLKQSRYHSLDECLQDFSLMFDNACKFNEPDSQIYKDALTLQNLAHRTFRKLQEDDENSVPDVQSAVQELLSFIFISMYNHQDAEERCFSDSLNELPEHDTVNGNKVRAFSLDLIKQRLDRGLYKRLDVFQKDIFAVLERARKISRSDSQIFEDAVELQSHFIKVRDEACGNGDVLQSKALLYTIADLNKEVDDLKVSKKTEQVEEEETEEEDEDKKNVIPTQEDSTTSAMFNQQEYTVGEFVYTEQAEKGVQPLIFLIENIYKSNGEDVMYGNRFFRPVETFHVSTRKFLENEVFRSDVHDSIPLSKIVGRCMIMPVRDYFSKKPEGFDDKDIYVCESRYASKARSFKKMKVFWNIPDHIKIVRRDAELEPKRVMSVFKERIEKHKEELEEIEAMIKNVDESLPAAIPWTNPEGGIEGATYYEQYTIPGPITLKRGDHVYVRAEDGKNLIAQIDTMWVGQADGIAYFHGPWFVTPREMPSQAPEVRFYKQEAFLSTISDSNPLLSVVGKTCVMEFKDYQTSRPTQFAEGDVFVCESVYDESKRAVRGPLPPTGLKQYEHSESVQTDEVYFFKNPIAVQKEPSPNTVGGVAKAPTTPSFSMDIDNEDSLDAPPSVGSSDAYTPSLPGQKKVSGRH